MSFTHLNTRCALCVWYLTRTNQNHYRARVSFCSVHVCVSCTCTRFTCVQLWPSKCNVNIPECFYLQTPVLSSVWFKCVNTHSHSRLMIVDVRCEHGGGAAVVSRLRGRRNAAGVTASGWEGLGVKVWEMLWRRLQSDTWTLWHTLYWLSSSAHCADVVTESMWSKQKSCFWYVTHEAWRDGNKHTYGG